ncbi:MAG: hypothetical protein RLZZ301_92 [Bacteroidota bacterium]
MLGFALTSYSSISLIFTKVISSATGDLNKDGILDQVLVKEDTTAITDSYQLEVYFGQENGGFTWILSANKAILSAYPDGKEGLNTGVQFTQVSIHNGVLWIETELLRGHTEHKFRYQNGRFELIGFSYANVEHDILYLIDYNLSTGRRIEKECPISSDTFKVTLDKTIKLNQLPSLSDFEPFTTEFLLND